MVQKKETKNRKFRVEKSKKGIRLDLFLCFSNDDLTRSYVKKAIHDSKVRVNDTVEKRANYKVKTGDIVVLGKIEKQESDKIIPQNIKVDIIYEDENIIVVNKPEGMVTHPATGNWKGTLINALVFLNKDLLQLGTKLRSGLINRIDKATSGIVLVGKNNKSIWYLSGLFKKRLVKKTYIAVVNGDISNFFKNNKSYVLKDFIVRNPKNRKKFSIDKRGKGKLAVTEVKFVKGDNFHGKKYSLVLAFPKTGRTHQIRVQLAGIGHGILGDPIYGKINYKRMLLHAWKIEFEDMNHKVMSFKAEIPKEFNPFLK